MAKQLVLVDGSSYFYRAFHAMPPLMNSKGQPTGAVYGVVNMIRRLRKDFDTQHIAMVFDAKGKTFRDDLYKEYKANREAMPDDLVVQHAPLMEIIEALGLPLLIVEGVEADDVIGTLAEQATEAGYETIISTGDKDMAQLVNKKVKLVNTMTEKFMDTDGVVEKFGIPPELIIDYLTLIGDKVDNVPGVDKVGPKTAVKWLTEYKDLDGIIANAEQIKGKVGENLRAATDQLPLSKKLVTIKTDVALPCTLDDLVIKAPDKEKLIESYQELEFKSWLNEILSNHDSQPKQETPSEYKTILKDSEFQSFLKKLKKAKYFAVDTETDSLDYMAANLVGLSFAIPGEPAVYIPVAHDYEGAPKQLNRDDVIEAIKPILENDKQQKIGQNIKYDYQILNRHGICMQGMAYDTMLESYILNSTQSRHDMDTLALKYLGRSTISFTDIAGTGKKQLTFNQIELDKAGEYAAEDADITLQLHETLFPQLAEQDGIASVFEKIEMPLVPILADMELYGVLIDVKKLEKQGKALNKRIGELEENIFELAGEEFNINSPKQLQTILYEKLDLPIIKKTPKGQPSTAEPVLQELAYDYPLPKYILEYRSLTKLNSTYVEALPRQIHDDTNRVHTSYNQAVTATGRLSSTSPNLQNIPVRTEEGRKIRQAFIAEKGKKIIAADYSQIELRIMAHLSGDDTLCKAFEHGLDIHSATAGEIFGVSVEDVSKEQRRRAKAINFGLIYGMSAFGLAKQIEVDRAIAEEYIDVYFKRYPGVKDYMENTRKQAHQHGYVETLSGRRLFLPDINAKNIPRQKAAERAAINAPMQGTAADIIKLAMISVGQWLHKAKLDATMIMQVHDELVFEVAEADCEQFMSKLPAKMTDVIRLKVPLEVSVGIGDNWDEAH